MKKRRDKTKPVVVLELEAKKTLISTSPHNPSPHTVKPSPHIVKPSSHTVNPSPHTVKPSPHTVNPSPHIVNPSPNINYRIGDLVWSPWSSVQWPAMITYDPHAAIFFRPSSSRNTANKPHPPVTPTHYHIQYFGIVPQRGWVPVKNLRPIKSPNENGNRKPSRRALWEDFKVAIEEVNKAVSLNIKQRKLTFIFNYDPPQPSKEKTCKVFDKRGVVKKMDVSLTKLSQKEITSKCKSVAMVTSDVAMETVSPMKETSDVKKNIVTMTTEDNPSEDVTMTTTDVSPRTTTKYSLRESVKLTLKKIDAIETSSPLSEVCNIGNITGPLFYSNTSTSSDTIGGTGSGTIGGTGSGTIGTDAVINNNELLVSKTNEFNKELISVPGGPLSCDFFPPPLNLLTPPSTGSETESTDMEIPPLTSSSSTTLVPKHNYKKKTKSNLSNTCNNLPGPDIGKQTSVCAICDNNHDELITCNGHCMCSFHIDCLGIITLPKGVDFTCDNCLLTPVVCFLCRKYHKVISEGSNKSHDALISCSHTSCNKHYHLSCVDKYSDTFKITHTPTLSLTCGLHSCTKCTLSSSSLSTCKSSHGNSLLQCIICPIALHKGTCLIAGCEILDDKRMLCYKHINLSTSLPQSVKHFNMNTCLHCGEGGSLICCDFCSAAYHVECLSDEHQSGCGQEEWYCPYCVSHDLPTYGSVVMVKCGAYRWWPAHIISPSDIPHSLPTTKLTQCMFLVQFYASKQYFWTHHGRVLMFTEECAQLSDTNSHKSSSHSATAKQTQALYNQAFQEALIAYREIKHKLEESIPKKKESKSYIPIKRNKYLVARPLINEEEAESCKCTASSPCTSSSNCINRAILVECSPKNCPVGSQCQNQCILNNLIAPSEIFHTGNRGWGLKATAPLSPGDFVVEYIGEVVDMATVQERLKKQQEVYNYYFLTLARNCIIDASQKSNCARFINHSCDPNCETQKWTVNGETRIGIFAIKDISPGTELTFDYRLDSLGNEKKECLCGAFNCSGFLGERPKQERLMGVVSSSFGKMSRGRKKHRMPINKGASPVLKKDKKNNDENYSKSTIPSNAIPIITDNKSSSNSLKKSRNTKATKRQDSLLSYELQGSILKPLISNHQSDESATTENNNKARKRKRSRSYSSGEYRQQDEDEESDPYDNECFICHEGGELVLCDAFNCHQVYHLSCLGLTDLPLDDFICPRHYCTACKLQSKGKEECGDSPEFQCFVCPRSFCFKHFHDNLKLTDTGSFRCLTGNCSQR